MLPLCDTRLDQCRLQMIVGEPLSTYLEADAANKSWTLKFCEDLEAKLMIILSRRLRSDTMKYHDPNKVPAEVMGEMLIKDIGLNFDYKEEIRPLVIRKCSACVTRLKMLTSPRWPISSSQGDSFGCDGMGRYFQS